MKLHESGENYLETILLLQRKNGVARAIDIANEMNFSRPSVSRAMSILKSAGHIDIVNNQITLTESGLSIASGVYEKHCFIKDFLIQIGVDESVASEDACKMEHIISEETFECLKVFFNNLKVSGE